MTLKSLQDIPGTQVAVSKLVDYVLWGSPKSRTQLYRIVDSMKHGSEVRKNPGFHVALSLCLRD